MKIGFLITARLKSTRLPFKILKDLNGKTVVERVIDRAKEVEGIQKVVLCTSTNGQDKPLVDIAKRNDVYCFTGSEVDVLKRLLDAAEFFDLDYILSATADNPLFSIEYANLIVKIFKKEAKDFIKIDGLPLGCALYGLKTKAIKVVCDMKNIIDTEIWGYFFDHPDIFDVMNIKVDGKLNRPDLRLTLDYDEDYKVIQNIYFNLNYKKLLELSHVIDYFDKNQGIAKINRSCLQHRLDQKIKSKIDDLFIKRREMIFELKNKIYKKI